MLEDETRPSTGEDEAPWLRRIAEISLKQERLLDLHLEGDITAEQFRAKSAELEEARLAAEGQLAEARETRAGATASWNGARKRSSPTTPLLCRGR
jgi:hypothetical protein